MFVLPSTARAVRPVNWLAGKAPRALNLGAVVAFAGVLAVGWFADHQNRTAFERREHSEVYGRVNLLRANLEGLIKGDAQLVRSLAAVIATEPDIDQARFEALARSLIGETDHIRMVTAAPDMVIRMVHPIAPNAVLVGLDHRRLPGHRAAVRRARDGGRMVLAGPLALEDGEALVAHAPVFVNRASGPTFWGVVSTVIDTAGLLGDGGLFDRGLGLDVLLVGRDGTGADGAPFFGDPAILEAAPVTAEVALPQGSWLIAAVPAGGWRGEPPTAWALWFAVLGIGALVVAPLPLAARLAEDRRRTIAKLEERERELERLSRRLDLALTVSTVGVWDYNVDRDELIWDNRMNELYAMPPNKRRHTYSDWRNRLHPDDLAAAEATFRAAIAGRARYATQFRVRLPGGEVRHIRAIGAVYRDGDGTFKIVGVNWDVSADVAREVELETKRREAEAASIAKSRFLATMSHEIRTPLSGVLGMLDLLLESPLDAEQRGRARIARASAATLLSILNDILDLSKLEADRLALEPVDMAIRTLVDEVAALFQPQADAKGIAIAVEASPCVPEWLVCDPVRLRQILINLVSNAIKFTDAGRITIRIGYDAATAQLTLAVEDTGVGIAADDHGRVFDPFIQLDSSLDRRVGGTGLGLAISRQLAALMAGTITLESAAGRGSTFTLTVRAEPGQAPPALAAAAPIAPAAVRPLNVLLVEDNHANQMIITALLERAGHSVTAVANGSEALDVVAPGRFDVVLMDVQMPRMDGPTATQAIRAMGAWAERLPIIALTANALAGDRERYLALGMTDYISKPIDPGALHAAVHRAAGATVA